jgi:hypothetical protein
MFNMKTPADAPRAAYCNDRDSSIARWQLGKMLHQLRDQAEGATPMFCAEHERRQDPDEPITAAYVRSLG